MMFLRSIVFLTVGASAWSADNYWQITLSDKFAHPDHHDEFWRTHKVGNKIEVYPACDAQAKPLATAQADSTEGWKLSGQFGNLSAKLDAKDKLILKLKDQNFGEGQRIARVSNCIHGIPATIRNIYPKGERSFAALTGGAAHLQAALGATLPTQRDPPLPTLLDIKDSLEYLHNGDAYACHTSKIAHSAVHPLQDVPTFGEIPDVWPGALLQGKLYARGSFAPISVPRSEDATISITGINLAAGSKYYTKIKGPTSRETVNTAIRELLSQKIEGTEASSIGFRTDIITSSDQLG